MPTLSTFKDQAIFKVSRKCQYLHQLLPQMALRMQIKRTANLIKRKDLAFPFFARRKKVLGFGYCMAQLLLKKGAKRFLSTHVGSY